MFRTPSVLADRLVLALGFAAILLTGFYGAEAPTIDQTLQSPLQTRLAIPYSRHHGGAPAPRNAFP